MTDQKIEKISGGKIREVVRNLLDKSIFKNRPYRKELENMLHKVFILSQEEAILLEKMKIPIEVYNNFKQAIYKELMKGIK